MPAVLIVAWATTAPPAEAQVYTLARVVVTGATRLPAATVAGMTGLKPPAQVTSIDIERARQRLLDSGLFASVAYRFAMARYSMTVTFTVQEPLWDAPILFDNFVWFTDEELVRAVARELPTFSGLAPSLPRSLRRIAQALDRLIQEAGIRGSVIYMPVDHAGGVSAYLYRVDLPASMPVCGIDLEGVSPAMAADAHASIRLATGQSYSRDFVRKILAANLLPLYGRRGYLKATYGDIRAKPTTAGACTDGVAASVVVREGRSYVWGGATWDGADLPAADLDARLGMTTGEVADTSRLERGLQAVRDHYVRQGYMAARVQHVFQFDEDAGTASASCVVVRGPRVKMGALEIRGLPTGKADVADALKAEWTLAAGEYYDALYVNAYLKVVRTKFPAVFREFPSVSVTVTPDAGATVNVTLTFSGSGRNADGMLLPLQIRHRPERTTVL